jgi:uncharacterized protein
MAIKNKLANNSGEERTWAMVAHLSAFGGVIVPVIGSILGPFLVWQLKGKEYPFVSDQAKEALNFQISMGIYFVVSAVLVIVLIGLLLLPLLAVVEFIFILVAAFRANQGERYRYPLTIRFIK